MRYLVRTNCEYSVVIDADNPEHALAKSEYIAMGEWEQAWAPHTVAEEVVHDE